MMADQYHEQYSKHWMMLDRFTSACCDLNNLDFENSYMLDKLRLGRSIWVPLFQEGKQVAR